MTKKRPILGIDLGTTNTLVAYARDGAPHVVSDSEGNRLLPSVVSFDESGYVVGSPAVERAAESPSTAVHSVKRLVGKRYDEVAPFAARLSYEVEPAEDGAAVVRIHERIYRPEEISSFILREAAKRAERDYGEPVSDAVVTVPAYFDDVQRQATRDAGRMAGLKVLRILNEPTAAALAYGLHEKKEGAIAVYDLGGGTFDISILQVTDGVFRVLSTHGDTALGGDDFDAALVAHLAGEAGLADEIAASADLRHAFRRAAAALKHALTEADSAEERLLFSGVTHRLSVTRAQFEALIEPLVSRTLDSAARALRDAELEVGEIDELVLVGGATRVPLVRKKTAAFFGRAPHTELNPDEVVAVGAAIQADILAGGESDMLLMDVIPLSLGLETVGGSMARLIERNATVPAEATEHFTTYADNQTGFDFVIVQGEREIARDNRVLGTFHLRGIPPMPSGMAKLMVTFAVDESAILTVSAVEERSGRRARVEVVPAQGMSAKEIDRLIEDAYDKAEDDFRRRMVADIRVEARQMIRATEKALKRADADLPGAERQSIENALSVLEKAMKTEQFRSIKNAYDALNQVSAPLAERMMDRAVHDAFANRRVDELDA